VKTSTQLKALIRNLSKEKKVEAEIILRNFMLERFLERISGSKYKDNFILKGGMLIAAMVGIDTRSTMDLDATIKGQILTESEIVSIINDIINISIDDNVIFTYKGIEEIREEADYPGYRVFIGAALDKTRQTIKIDITTGDFVTPKEVEYSFNLMFEDRSINIWAYNIETVLAEKFETSITRGVTNSRMRDFYDIYILTTTQAIDINIFREALKKTVEKRQTVRQMSDIAGVIKNIFENPYMIDLWEKYQEKYSYAAEITWEMAINAIKWLADNIEEKELNNP
jgi:predicted nucleotidyltransferase component of viral defense system